jgi:hypothetical protein
MKKGLLTSYDHDVPELARIRDEARPAILTGLASATLLERNACLTLVHGRKVKVECRRVVEQDLAPSIA